MYRMKAEQNRRSAAHSRTDDLVSDPVYSGYSGGSVGEVEDAFRAAPRLPEDLTRTDLKVRVN